MFNKLKKVFSHAPVNRVSGPVEYIICGLGNPGSKYQKTRHNAGFLTLDILADKLGVNVDKIKHKSLVGDAMIDNKRVLLVKPQTFMNLSGQAVTEIAAFYKVPYEKIIVIFDDISLNVGIMRIRKKGSDGGHNGIKNILELSGTDVFPRIKIGVGEKPNPDMDLAAWVTSTFNENELKPVFECMKNAAEAACLIISDKEDEAMNKYSR
jgi:peptidyl-tRNA hydrolase, PTH1 family